MIVLLMRGSLFGKKKKKKKKRNLMLMLEAIIVFITKLGVSLKR